MEINGELEAGNRVMIRSKYRELIELIHSIEPKKGRRVFPEEGESIATMRTVCKGLSALASDSSYRKYRMKDRITVIDTGEEDGKQYLDVYVMGVTE